MQSTKKCFECGNPATENHHVIPQSMGGTKTVPLCSKCHMKVHNLENSRRADGNIELTNRGLDKSRVWNLFALYQAYTIYYAETDMDVKKIFEDIFDQKYSLDSIKRLIKRYSKMDEDYLLSLFDKEIDPCFAYLWDEDKAIEKVNSIYKLISEIIKEILDSHLSESEIVKLIRNKLITINNNC
jgi:hypothetical protein